MGSLPLESHRRRRRQPALTQNEDMGETGRRRNGVRDRKEYETPNETQSAYNQRWEKDKEEDSSHGSEFFCAFLKRKRGVRMLVGLLGCSRKKFILAWRERKRDGEWMCILVPFKRLSFEWLLSSCELNELWYWRFSLPRETTWNSSVEFFFRFLFNC